MDLRTKLAIQVSAVGGFAFGILSTLIIIIALSRVDRCQIFVTDIGSKNVACEAVFRVSKWLGP